MPNGLLLCAELPAGKPTGWTSSTAQHSSACRLDPRVCACVLIHITLQVQNVIDVWASAGERIQLAFSWTDPLATAVLVVVMLLLALGLWVLGLQVLVTVGLLWVFR